REPWLLVASAQFSEEAPKHVVRRYRQHMQIEESFRDLKSQHFNEGLERSRSAGSGRFTVLVLIATLAAFLLWLLGTAAERLDLHRWLHPGNGKRRVYSRLFLARLLFVLDSCRVHLDDVMRWDRSTNGSRTITMRYWWSDLGGPDLWGYSRVCPRFRARG
ncbi:MAG TPA: transposase, partial [Lamprocystis sp. (in: g-proteobacteria)]|nr:transposase [Lamprocystis sp. (in: g-proteobacteria)]